jgi:hypothetical protein
MGPTQDFLTVAFILAAIIGLLRGIIFGDDGR